MLCARSQAACWPGLVSRRDVAIVRTVSAAPRRLGVIPCPRPHGLRQPRHVPLCTSAPAPAPTPTPFNLQTITAALSQANEAFNKFDVDNSGALTKAEALALLNSDEMREIVQTLTNVAPLARTEDDISKAFDAADKNKDGVLSRKEFLALCLAVFRDRIAAHPAVLAEALLGFLDTDRNGKIDGGELKILLAILGFPAALLLPIPKAIGVDYRSVLRMWNGEKN